MAVVVEGYGYVLDRVGAVGDRAADGVCVYCSLEILVRLICCDVVDRSIGGIPAVVTLVALCDSPCTTVWYGLAILAAGRSRFGVAVVVEGYGYSLDRVGAVGDRAADGVCVYRSLEILVRLICCDVVDRSIGRVPAAVARMDGSDSRGSSIWDGVGICAVGRGGFRVAVVAEGYGYARDRIASVGDGSADSVGV